MRYSNSVILVQLGTVARVADSISIIIHYPCIFNEKAKHVYLSAGQLLS